MGSEPRLRQRDLVDTRADGFPWNVTPTPERPQPSPMPDEEPPAPPDEIDDEPEWPQPERVPEEEPEPVGGTSIGQA